MKKHAEGLRTAACLLGGLLLVYGVLALFPRPDNFPGDNLFPKNDLQQSECLFLTVFFSVPGRRNPFNFAENS